MRRWRCWSRISAFSAVPVEQRRELRDRLASQGVPRVTALGAAGVVESGLPHDGFLLGRFIRWVNDEDGLD
ncbi:MAG: acyl-CoA reductase [Novosphingobium sp.]